MTQAALPMTDDILSKLTELVETQKDNQAKAPWYIEIVKTQGVATVLLLLVGLAVFVKGGDWFDVYLENIKTQTQQNASYIESQKINATKLTESFGKISDATKQLVEQVEMRNAFESKVMADHEAQTKMLMGVNEAVTEIPEMRQKELQYLQENQDLLKSIDENTKRTP
jgi:hypothetical protein